MKTVTVYHLYKLFKTKFIYESTMSIQNLLQIDTLKHFKFKKLNTDPYLKKIFFFVTSFPLNKV